MEINDVQAVTQTDGSVTITFTAPEAGSAGVQYVTGTSGQPMADCYVAEAQRADGLGKVTLTGLTPGQVISYRVYAARTAGVSCPSGKAGGESCVENESRRTFPLAVSAGSAVSTVGLGRTITVLKRDRALWVPLEIRGDESRGLHRFPRGVLPCPVTARFFVIPELLPKRGC